MNEYQSSCIEAHLMMLKRFCAATTWLNTDIHHSSHTLCVIDQWEPFLAMGNSKLFKVVIDLEKHAPATGGQAQFVCMAAVGKIEKLADLFQLENRLLLIIIIMSIIMMYREISRCQTWSYHMHMHDKWLNNQPIHICGKIIAKRDILACAQS